MFELENIKAVLLDLDGTVYLDDELIGDVINTLNYMRKKGIRLVYLTNNSSKTDDEYIEKLSRLGIYDQSDIFYSSLDAAADYIKLYYPGKTVFPMATAKVTDYLKCAGVPLSEKADIALLTFDKELTYRKLEKFNYLLAKGAVYISTHPDYVCPTKDVFIPDAGSFISLFKTSSGREPDVVIGKPNKPMAEMLLKKLHLQPEQIAMVGDRLYTDIAFGANNGFLSVLVLSGETSLKDYENSVVKADIVLENLDCLKKYI